MEQEEISDARTTIQVVVRVRPVLPHESVNDVAVTCSPEGNKVTVVLPDKSGSSKQNLPGSGARAGARSYAFDACLHGSTSAEDLSSVCGLTELVEQALDGYSVTVFAFGQTGSGKTHTIIGPRLSRAVGGSDPAYTGAGGRSVPSSNVIVADSEDGLLPRCVAAAYAGVAQRADQADYTITTSCIELYNEAVVDLLSEDKAKTLQVRKDERNGFRVEGLIQLGCSTAGSALKAFSKALLFRHTRSHALNEYSSRSHCIMTMVFSSKEKEGDQGAQGGLRRYGKLVLVDLAGSERLGQSGSSGRDAVRETGAINKSLFTLGQVLGALAARASRPEGTLGQQVHIPFRDSKLTQLLWDGLRGDGRVLMVACLAPMRAAADETMNTLHFASMATRIKARPVILLDPQDALVMELRTTIRQLQVENRQLASAMMNLNAGADANEVLASLPGRLRASSASPSPTWPAPASETGHAGSSAGISLSTSYSSPLPGGPTPQVGHAAPHTNTQQRMVSNLLAAAPINYSYDLSAAPSPAWQGGARSRGNTQHAHGKRRGAHGAGGPQPARVAGTHPGNPNGGVSHSSFSAPLATAGQGARVQAGPYGASQASPQVLLPPAPPVMDHGAFPELASLEAEFQMMMAGVMGQAQGSPLVQPDNRPYTADESDSQGPGSGSGGEEEASVKEAPPTPSQQPEPKALHWAEQNTWFGSDTEMTQAAYAQHDHLIAQPGFDSTSDDYYESIEAAVAAHFPDKWTAWAAHLEAEAAAKAEAEAAARAAAREEAEARAKGKEINVSPPRKRPAPVLPAAHNFGAALRVALKDTSLGFTGLAVGPYSPQQAYVNPRYAAMAANPNELPVSVTPATLLLQPPWSLRAAPNARTSGNGVVLPLMRTMRTRKGETGSNASSAPSSGAPSASKRRPSPQKQLSAHGQGRPPLGGLRYGSGSSGPGTPVSSPPVSSPVAASPGGSRSRLHRHSPGGMAMVARLLAPAASSPQMSQARPGPNWVNSLVASPGTKARAGWGLVWQETAHQGLGVHPPVNSMSHREMEAEYVRQRQAVLEELRVAKEEAERERARILGRINATLGASRWRVT